MKKIPIAVLAFFVFGSLIFAPHPLKVEAMVIDNELASRTLFALSNAERQKVGLPELAYSPTLSQAAYAKASDMLARGYFDHVSPGGKPFYRWVDSTGYEYAAVGENLALNLNTDEMHQIVDSWLNSPGHRANLLSNNYTEAGMGVASGTYQGKDAVFAVHIFATPKKTQNLNARASAPAALAAAVSEAVLPLKAQAQSVQVAEAPRKNILVKNAGTFSEVSSSSELLAEIETHEYAANTPTAKIEAQEAHQNNQSFLQKFIKFFLAFYKN